MAETSDSKQTLSVDAEEEISREMEEARRERALAVSDPAYVAAKRQADAELGAERSAPIKFAADPIRDARPPSERMEAASAPVPGPSKPKHIPTHRELKVEYSPDDAKVTDPERALRHEKTQKALPRVPRPAGEASRQADDNPGPADGNPSEADDKPRSKAKFIALAIAFLIVAGTGWVVLAGGEGTVPAAEPEADPMADAREGADTAQPVQTSEPVASSEPPIRATRPAQAEPPKESPPVTSKPTAAPALPAPKASSKPPPSKPPPSEPAPKVETPPNETKPPTEPTQTAAPPPSAKPTSTSKIPFDPDR